MADLQKLRADLDAIREMAAREGYNPRFGTLAVLDAIDRVGVDVIHELTLIRQNLQTIAAQGVKDA